MTGRKIKHQFYELVYRCRACEALYVAVSVPKLADAVTAAAKDEPAIHACIGHVIKSHFFTAGTGGIADLVAMVPRKRK